MTPYLEIDRLSKRFGALTVLDDVSLGVGAGEILALLGPSGSGKTTLLRLLAGFETADGGALRVGGRDVTRQPPAQRGFGMVFQHYALFPHLTVAGNVAFGLESRTPRPTPSEITQRVAEALELVDLGGFERRKVSELSGGQQQRVALARALAPKPQLLLLDEPLSNLDPSLRERTRRELRRAVQQVGITTVLVTHEQEEAFDLGDRVALLWRGQLQQVGTPEELYGEPANPFVASFIGRSSRLTGTARLTHGTGRVWVRLNAEGGPMWAAAEVEGLAEGDAVELAVRPEALQLVSAADRAADRAAESLVCQVISRRFAGPFTTYQVVVVCGGQERELEVLAPAVPPAGVQLGRPARLVPNPAGPLPRAFRALGAAR